MKKIFAMAIVFICLASVIVVAIILTSPWGEQTAVEETILPDVRVETFLEMKQEGNAVYVEDQMSGALIVSVGFVLIDEPGYVEIHADDEGVPGEIIGTSPLLSAPGAEHLEISLSAPLSDHAVYYAMVTNAKKVPVTDSQDHIVLMSFAARSDATPETGAIEP